MRLPAATLLSCQEKQKAISATPSTPNFMQDAALVSYKDSELRTMIKSSKKAL